MYTDIALKVVSEAGSLRSTCELSHVVKDHFMTNRVLIVYLVPFFLASLKRPSLMYRSILYICLSSSQWKGSLTKIKIHFAVTLRSVQMCVYEYKTRIRQ